MLEPTLTTASPVIVPNGRVSLIEILPRGSSLPEIMTVFFAVPATAEVSAASVVTVTAAAPPPPVVLV